MEYNVEKRNLNSLPPSYCTDIILVSKFLYHMQESGKGSSCFIFVFKENYPQVSSVIIHYHMKYLASIVLRIGFVQRSMLSSSNGLWKCTCMFLNGNLCNFDITQAEQTCLVKYLSHSIEKVLSRFARTSLEGCVSFKNHRKGTLIT